MSSTFINENDIARLTTESQLTEQAPRVLPPEPSAVDVSDENPGIALIKALAALLMGDE